MRTECRSRGRGIGASREGFRPAKLLPQKLATGEHFTSLKTCEMFRLGLGSRPPGTGQDRRPRAKLETQFAVFKSMNSTAKNAKTALNVIGCLALLHAIRSGRTPRRTRLRNVRTGSA